MSQRGEGGQGAVTRVPGDLPAEAERGRSRSRSNKADKKIGIVLEDTHNFAQIDKILKEVPFFKNLTRRRQHPCYVDPCLKGSKQFAKIDNNSQGSAIFQKSDPPEAAPLLDPCLKGAKLFAKIDTILKEVSFFKNLTRRRQHPC